MAVLEGGVSASLAEIGVGAAKGLHVIAKPTDYGSLGHYRIGVSTGILPAALAANSEVFQFRWTDATRLCNIMRVRITASVTTTMFAAGVPVEIDLIKSTGWTVAGTGGTAITPSTDLKLRTSMGSTLLVAGDMRVATTAALGAGTKTLETNAMSKQVSGGPITASLNGTIFPLTDLLEPDVASGSHPLTLVQNEGFSIRSNAVPATGTWRMAIQVAWHEVTAY